MGSLRSSAPDHHLGHLDPESLTVLPTQPPRRFVRRVGRLARSDTDQSVMPYVPDLGVQGIAYAHRQAALDQWVGEVGRAFQNVGGDRRLMHTANGDVWVVVTTTDVLDPEVLRQERSDARALADRLKQDAENDRDMTDDLAQLQADAAVDPRFAATVFESLGPGVTLVIASRLEDHPGQLQAFDESLARASDHWQATGDHSFVDGLLHGDLPGYTTELFRWAHLSSLFRYGVYARDFLETAADEFFFTTHDELDHDGYRTMMEALDRNPAAARDWLMGQQSWYGHDGSRLTLLLDGQANDRFADWSPALGRTIYDAGQTITDTDVRERFFKDMAVDYRLVPEGARSGIARFLGQHISDPYFLTVNPTEALEGHGYVWQYRLLMVAELGGDSRVIPDNAAVQHPRAVPRRAGAARVRALDAGHEHRRRAHPLRP